MNKSTFFFGSEVNESHECTILMLQKARHAAGKNANIICQQIVDVKSPVGKEILCPFAQRSEQQSCDDRYGERTLKRLVEQENEWNAKQGMQQIIKTQFNNISIVEGSMGPVDRQEGEKDDTCHIKCKYFFIHGAHGVLW